MKFSNLQIFKFSNFFVSAALCLLCACSGNGVKEPVRLELSSAEMSITDDCNDFSFELLKSVYANDATSENIIVSPLSASMLLGMVMNGADGNTLAQMRDVLDFDEDMSLLEINEYYRKLIDALPALDKTNKVCIANSIWAQNGYPFYDNFLNTNKKYFSAAVRNVDFSDSKTVDVINKWASDNTNKLIPKVVEQQDLADVRMLLANALYFNGIWREEFDKSDTRQQEFTTSSGQAILVDRMNQTHDFAYADLEDAQLLEMNYKENMYCMDILLPAEGRSLNDIVDKLDADSWRESLAKMDFFDVTVSMPKFKLGYNTSLVKALLKMGMSDAFNPMQADFSRMSENELYLSQVKQFCQLNVDEKGTEAAAITWGTMKDSAVGPDFHRNFIVNRPFMLVIRERQYGTILFIATIGNPLAE